MNIGNAANISPSTLNNCTFSEELLDVKACALHMSRHFPLRKEEDEEFNGHIFRNGCKQAHIRKAIGYLHFYSIAQTHAFIFSVCACFHKFKYVYMRMCDFRYLILYTAHRLYWQRLLNKLGVTCDKNAVE